MKKTIISFVAAGVLASVASAQLYVVQGGTTGVKAQFTFSINDVANTVTVAVDNTILGIGNAKGTITAFGFNTPFSDAQLGTNGSLVAITSQTINGSTSTWVKDEPWVVNPGYNQDFGVSTDGGPEGSNPTNGIKWGMTASFVFTFPDFGAADSFLGTNGLSVRFQEVLDFQGRTGQSDKVFGNPDEGGGGGSGFVPEPSTYGLLGALALLSLMVVRQVRRR